MTAIYPRRTRTYADYPACLVRYRWLVEDALKSTDKSRMFNNVSRNGYYSCKVCGADEDREHFEDHILRHAKQLKLIENEPVDNPEMFEDVKATIADSIEEKADDVVFENADLVVSLATAIVNETAEGSAGEPAFCDDCTD